MIKSSAPRITTAAPVAMSVLLLLLLLAVRTDAAAGSTSRRTVAVSRDYAVSGYPVAARFCVQQSRRGSWVTAQVCIDGPTNATRGPSTLGSVVDTDGATVAMAADPAWGVVRLVALPSLVPVCNVTLGSSVPGFAADAALSPDGTLLLVSSAGSANLYLYEVGAGCPAVGVVVLSFEPEHVAWIGNATVLATRDATVTAVTITTERDVFTFSLTLPAAYAANISSVHAVRPLVRGVAPVALLGMTSLAGADGTTTPSTVACTLNVVSSNVSCRVLQLAPASSGPFRVTSAPWLNAVSAPRQLTAIELIASNGGLTLAVTGAALSRTSPGVVQPTFDMNSDTASLATMLEPNPVAMFAVAAGVAPSTLVIDGPTQDCVWSNWTDYSACSAACGTGMKVRNRTVVSWAQFYGQPCPGLPQEVAPCQYYEWKVNTTAAGPCYRTGCGTGVRTTSVSCWFCGTQLVDDSYCHSTDPLPLSSSTLPCDPDRDAPTLFAPYTVQYGPWSLDDDACKNVAHCGVPRTRNAKCVACDGTVVDGAFCGAAGSATETQYCPCSSPDGGGVGCTGSPAACSDLNACLPTNPCPDDMLVCHDLIGNYYANPFVCGATTAPPVTPAPTPASGGGGCFLGHDATVVECDPTTGAVIDPAAPLSLLYGGPGPFTRRYVQTGSGGCEPVLAMQHRDVDRALPPDFMAVRICTEVLPEAAKGAEATSGASSRRCVTMSYEHLMLDSDGNAILALYVKPNVTRVHVLSDANPTTAVHVALVVSVDVVPSPVGLFAPLTPSGRIAVNGIVVSCFTYNIVVFGYHSAKSPILSALMPPRISDVIAWLLVHVVGFDEPVSLEAGIHPVAGRLLTVLGTVSIAFLWTLAATCVWLTTRVVLPKDPIFRRRVNAHVMTLLAAFAAAAWMSVSV